MSKYIYLLLISFLLLSIACRKNNQEDLQDRIANCLSIQVTYNAVINPILMTNCAVDNCHSNASMAGNLSLENYNNVKTIVDNGLLIKVINHEVGVPAMPYDRPKMDPCTISKIERWVVEGARNN